MSTMKIVDIFESTFSMSTFSLSTFSNCLNNVSTFSLSTFSLSTFSLLTFSLSTFPLCQHFPSVDIFIVDIFKSTFSMSTFSLSTFSNCFNNVSTQFFMEWNGSNLNKMVRQKTHVLEVMGSNPRMQYKLISSLEQKAITCQDYCTHWRVWIWIGTKLLCLDIKIKISKIWGCILVALEVCLQESIL